MPHDTIKVVCSNCGEHSISFTWFQNNNTIKHPCERYYLCPIWEQSPQQCNNKCKFFSTENKIVIVCPFCNTANTIYLPLSWFTIHSQHNALVAEDSPDGTDVSISSIQFTKDATYVNIKRIDDD